MIQITNLLKILLNHAKESDYVIGYYLNKLKVRRPVVFVITQVSLLTLTLLFVLNKININDEVDTFIISLLGIIISSISPRTTSYSEVYKETKNSSEDTKDRELLDTKHLQEEESVGFDGFIDQSNNT